MSTPNTNKKRVIAALSTIAIAGSIGIGGMLLNNTPQDKLDLLPINPVESVITSPIPMPTSTPVAKPSTSPKVSVVPSKTPLPTKTPKAVIEVVEVKPPETLEVVVVPPAKVDTLTQFGISGKYVTTAKYAITKLDSSRSEFSVDIPETLSADMFELYLNYQYIDKQLLPLGKVIGPPLIFTDIKSLEVRIIKLEQVIGIGKFEDGVLMIYLKDGVSHE